MATSPTHGGFRRDAQAKTVDIFMDGERSIGFASFETLYSVPTVVQHAPIGHAVFDPMGGMWRYCKAGAAITTALYGAAAYAQPTDLTPGAAAIGDMTIDCTGSSDATCDADQYVNSGMVVVPAGVGNYRFYHIKGNTASSTTTTTLELYQPVQYTIAGTEWATLNPCPWADVRPMGAYSSVCCMPLQSVTSGYYFWGKTRGPVYGVPTGTVPGAASMDRLCVFSSDGSIKMADESWNAGTSYQIAGWLMPRTGGAYGGGDQSFYLQIE